MNAVSMPCWSIQRKSALENELRSIVTAQEAGSNACAHNAGENLDDASCVNAASYVDSKAFTCPLVDDSQALDGAAIGEYVEHEIIARSWWGRLGGVGRARFAATRLQGRLRGTRRPAPRHKLARAHRFSPCRAERVMMSHAPPRARQREPRRRPPRRRVIDANAVKYVVVVLGAQIESKFAPVRTGRHDH